MGGIEGWYMGYNEYEKIEKNVMEMYGKIDNLESLRGKKREDEILMMIIK